jgi:hypothetical protein
MITLIAASMLFSCEKTYECEIVTPGLTAPTIYTFKGTNKEMKEFEATANTAYGQTINCK